MVTSGSRDSAPAHDPKQFRYVLGQHPTGVTLITATQADGDPVGMVVGTFTSVSLNPPLVAFLPDRSSSSWPKIRASGSFCANVLTSAQEDVCRAFAQKRDDRFTASLWSLTGAGGMRLEGAAAWIDCTIEDVIPAGDHDIVLGRVRDLGVGDSADLPLLFLRGGYGSFSIPSIHSLDTALPRHLRAVDAARPEIESLATDLQVECLVTVAIEDTVVVVSAAGVERSPIGIPSRVGIAFPLAAPLALVHVAWAGEDTERRWLAEGRRLLGSIDAGVVKKELVSVRDQGYAVTTGLATRTEWERSASTESETGLADLTGVMRHLLTRLEAGTNQITAPNVTSLQAPVFGPDGQVAIGLSLSLHGDESAERLQSCLDRMLLGAARLTAQLGGSIPE
jgi:flavin reductase (DIM6/NTAB) family NADH-FMN oxidoreductase RutF/DNA-binding IclR family transcriptional regulator